MKIKSPHLPILGPVGFNLATLVVAFALVMPFAFFSEIAAKLIFIAALAGFSRSSLLNNSMTIEIHSFLIIITAHLFGFGPAAYIAIVSASLEPIISPLFGTAPNPMFLVLDIAYMMILGFVASGAGAEKLVFMSLLAIVVIDHGILNIIRWITLPDRPKHWINSGINIMINYFLLTRVLEKAIAFFN